MTTLLEVKGIQTYYGPSHILHDVSFHAAPREVVALLGRNGVGKTTTLRSLLNLPRPRAGDVVFDGESILAKPTHAIIRGGISWVPQGHRIFPDLTTYENLALAARHVRPGPWTIPGVFELFPGLAKRRDALGGTLSGGEQQMLAIGRAVVQNPLLILMDEPSEGLSPKIVKQVASVIKTLNESGCTILIVEQNLAFALSISDRVMIMSKGRIVFSGAPSELAERPDISQEYIAITAPDVVRKVVASRHAR